MNDYDIYLREQNTFGGEWRGFLLAWKGLGRIDGLPARPHTRFFPWIPDPGDPNNPAAGSWGVLQWRLQIALVDDLAGLNGVPLSPVRTAATMRNDLATFMPLLSMELKDVDGTVCPVRMTGYTEQAIVPCTPETPTGGFIAVVEFARV